MNLRILSLIFVLLSVTFLPHGVAQGWVWATNAGEGGNETATSVTTDASGNVYVTGSFSSGTVPFGTFPLTNNTTGYTDIFLTKYDANGNVLWARSAGGSDNDYATSVTTDAWGNIYVAGYFYSSSIVFGTTTLTNDSTPATSDMYVVKYDASGNVIWARKSGGTMDDRINAVKTDVSGNVIVTGSFESKYLVFGTDTVKNPLATTDDVFVIKYDSAGNYIWAIGSGHAGFNYGNALAVDASGNIFVAGDFNSNLISFGDTVLTNSGSGFDDMFLVKFNSAGVVQWARNAAGTNDDAATALGTDAHGNIYVAGNFASSTLLFNTTTLTNSGGYDLFVAKYNTNGKVLWAKRNGGTAGDYVYSLAVDDSSYVVIAGNFGSASIGFGATTLTNDSAGTKDLFLAKYDSTGNVLWANTTGGPTSNANSVAIYPPGNIYLAGDFSDSTFAFGTNLLTNFTNTGTTDMFLAKFLQTVLQAGNITPATAKMAVYPNPADGILNVALNEGGYNSIGVYDCLGRTLYQSQLTGNEKAVRINTAEIKDGVYFLRATHNGAMESATFIIRR